MKRLAAVFLLILPLGCYSPGPAGDDAGCQCCGDSTAKCKGCGRDIKTGTACADCENCSKKSKP